MILIVVITVFMIAIPTLYVVQEKYVRELAWLIGLSQLAYLACSGKLDYLLSDWCVSAYNKAISLFYNIIFEKFVCLFIA